ncbi:MAG: hypothetical protein PHV60_10090 [bacterium]|nr:hypothetical protein [bacterium]
MNNKNMYHKLLPGIAVLFFLAVVLVTGCVKPEPSIATATISEVTMSKNLDDNDRPVDPTNVFPADIQSICLSFKISGFPVGTEIQVQWIYLGGDPEAEALTGTNYVAETQTATVAKEGTGYTATVYSRPGISGYEAWPRGDYKVVISAGGQEKGTASFKIQ